MKKIVIKIGTNVLSQENGLLDISTMAHLSAQISQLKQKGLGIIVVSSGAVGAGRKVLPQLNALGKIEQRQIWAAVGQVRLMNTYVQLFEQYGIHVAQVLATKEDFRDRQHYLNMRGCFEALLKDNIIPIVNENDVIAVNELMFTDNDELAGLIATMCNADTLIILSNVEGVLDGHPNNLQAKIIPLIDADDRYSFNLILPSTSSFGRGGMHTKFRMAQKAARLGITTIIANGKCRDVLLDLAAGKPLGTRFISKKEVSNVKKWLAYNESSQKGTIIINEKAVLALTNREKISSLLPIGVIHVAGKFEKGDIIRIIDEQGSAIGLGIAQVSAVAALKSMGLSKQKALIHYDYLIVF